MKKVIMFLVLGLLLTGVNLYAEDGDFIVEGNVNISDGTNYGILYDSSLNSVGIGTTAPTLSKLSVAVSGAFNPLITGISSSVLQTDNYNVFGMSLSAIFNYEDGDSERIGRGFIILPNVKTIISPFQGGLIL